MKSELCAYSVEACRAAARLGVDRVELCASPTEGGITPSFAAIERVAAIEGLELSVMIRPRGGDFLYSTEEFETMLRDIELARKAGATGVVFGVLTKYGGVDRERTHRLVEAAEGLQTTFHRAVDMTRDYLEAIEDIIAAGCTRILTSGGYNKAIDGKENIAEAVSVARGRIEIMAGSGIASGNALELASTGVDAIHFSAKKMVASGMRYCNPHISMGGCDSVDEYALRTIDEDEVLEILKLLKHRV